MVKPDKPLTKIEETTGSKKVMRCAFCEEYKDERDVIRIGAQGSICPNCYRTLLERICRDMVVVATGDSQSPVGPINAVVEMPLQNLKLKARHEIHIRLKGE